ncbi:peptidylprolyl isomerase [Paraferrimonas sp. SM1919]|uniref:peptidylprolyl isomerase n=1 Tax=Paraferrimonas sp. SM1919 TaxID=2662263 RepID=UPI0013D1D292|nr:peptidylprolyl isomerase [Paraferrimonas sp. SM1919]
MKKLLPIYAALFLAACGGSDDVDEPQPTPPVPKVEMNIDVCYLMQTSMGDITFGLDKLNAPNTSDNFEKYIEVNHYDGLIFHRVIENFVVQGGGYNQNYEPVETFAPIANEANNGLSNLRGTFAMARTNQPHSATAQFYINHQDNRSLDYSSDLPNSWGEYPGYGYAVFGQVLTGMDIVDQMAQVEVDYWNLPTTNIVIETIYPIDCPSAE